MWLVVTVLTTLLWGLWEILAPRAGSTVAFVVVCAVLFVVTVVGIRAYGRSRLP